MTIRDLISIDTEFEGAWKEVRKAFKKHKISFSAFVVKIVIREFTNGGWCEFLTKQDHIERKLLDTAIRTIKGGKQ